MSKFVGTGPSSYKKRIYRTAVSQRLRNTALQERYYLFSSSFPVLLTSKTQTIQRPDFIQLWIMKC